MMGDEEIDRTEQISYRQKDSISTNTIIINSKIAYYKRSVHMYSIIILHALQFGVHSEQWVGHVYVTNIIFILSKT